MSDAHQENTDHFCECVIASDQTQALKPKCEILDELKRRGYPEDDVFAVKLALEEAITNAVRHGNESDPAKTVTIKWSINDDRVIVVVRDEGPGFVPDQIPDPTHPERLCLPCGRGILLIKAYMDQVEYRDNGREVLFIKTRKSSAGAP